MKQPLAASVPPSPCLPWPLAAAAAAAVLVEVVVVVVDALQVVRPAFAEPKLLPDLYLGLAVE